MRPLRVKTAGRTGAFIRRRMCWAGAEIIDGQQKLTQLRLFEEEITVPEGPYGEKLVEQVRVLTPGAFEIHQKDKKGDYRVVEEGTTSLDEIPFAVAYANRVGHPRITATAG